ncbi:FAM184 family like protein, partial [Aduncisulcus paluster]
RRESEKDLEARLTSQKEHFDALLSEKTAQIESSEKQREIDLIALQRTITERVAAARDAAQKETEHQLDRLHTKYENLIREELTSSDEAMKAELATLEKKRSEVESKRKEMLEAIEAEREKMLMAMNARVRALQAAEMKRVEAENQARQKQVATDQAAFEATVKSNNEKFRTEISELILKERQAMAEIRASAEAEADGLYQERLAEISSKEKDIVQREKDKANEVILARETHFVTVKKQLQGELEAVRQEGEEKVLAVHREYEKKRLEVIEDARKEAEEVLSKEREHFSSLLRSKDENIAELTKKMEEDKTGAEIQSQDKIRAVSTLADEKVSQIRKKTESEKEKIEKENSLREEESRRVWDNERRHLVQRHKVEMQQIKEKHNEEMQGVGAERRKEGEAWAHAAIARAVNEEQVRADAEEMAQKKIEAKEKEYDKRTKERIQTVEAARKDEREELLGKVSEAYRRAEERRAKGSESAEEKERVFKEKAMKELDELLVKRSEQLDIAIAKIKDEHKQQVEEIIDNGKRDLEDVRDSTTLVITQNTEKFTAIMEKQRVKLNEEREAFRKHEAQVLSDAADERRRYGNSVRVSVASEMKKQVKEERDARVKEREEMSKVYLDNLSKERKEAVSREERVRETLSNQLIEKDKDLQLALSNQRSVFDREKEAGEAQHQKELEQVRDGVKEAESRMETRFESRSEKLLESHRIFMTSLESKHTNEVALRDKRISELSQAKAELDVQKEAQVASITVKFQKQLEVRSASENERIESVRKEEEMERQKLQRECDRKIQAIEASVESRVSAVRTEMDKLMKQVKDAQKQKDEKRKKALVTEWTRLREEEDAIRSALEAKKKEILNTHRAMASDIVKEERSRVDNELAQMREEIVRSDRALHEKLMSERSSLEHQRAQYESKVRMASETLIDAEKKRMEERVQQLKDELFAEREKSLAENTQVQADAENSVLEMQKQLRSEEEERMERFRKIVEDEAIAQGEQLVAKQREYLSQESMRRRVLELSRCEFEESVRKRYTAILAQESQALQETVRESKDMTERLISEQREANRKREEAMIESFEKEKSLLSSEEKKRREEEFQLLRDDLAAREAIVASSWAQLKDREAAILRSSEVSQQKYEDELRSKYNNMISLFLEEQKEVHSRVVSELESVTSEMRKSVEEERERVVEMKERLGEELRAEMEKRLAREMERIAQKEVTIEAEKKERAKREETHKSELEAHIRAKAKETEERFAKVFEEAQEKNEKMLSAKLENERVEMKKEVNKAYVTVTDQKKELEEEFIAKKRQVEEEMDAALQQESANGREAIAKEVEQQVQLRDDQHKNHISEISRIEASCERRITDIRTECEESLKTRDEEHASKLKAVKKEVERERILLQAQYEQDRARMTAETVATEAETRADFESRLEREREDLAAKLKERAEEMTRKNEAKSEERRHEREQERESRTKFELNTQARFDRMFMAKKAALEQELASGKEHDRVICLQHYEAQLREGKAEDARIRGKDAVQIREDMRERGDANLREWNDKLEDIRAKFDKEFVSREEIHAEKVQEMKKKCADGIQTVEKDCIVRIEAATTANNKTIERLQANHSESRASLLKSHTHTLQQLEEQHEARVASVKQGAVDKEAQMKKEFALEKKELIDGIEIRIKAVQDERAKAMDEAKERHEAEICAVQSAMEEQRVTISHDREVYRSQLESQYIAREQTQSARHEAIMRQREEKHIERVKQVEKLCDKKIEAIEEEVEERATNRVQAATLDAQMAKEEAEKEIKARQLEHQESIDIEYEKQKKLTEENLALQEKLGGQELRVKKIAQMYKTWKSDFIVENDKIVADTLKEKDELVCRLESELRENQFIEEEAKRGEELKRRELEQRHSEEMSRVLRTVREEKEDRRRRDARVKEEKLRGQAQLKHTREKIRQLWEMLEVGSHDVAKFLASFSQFVEYCPAVVSVCDEELRRLTDLAPIFELVTRREFVKNRIFAFNSAANDPDKYHGADSARFIREGKQRQEFRNEIGRINDQLGTLLKQYESRYQRPFIYREKHYLDVMASDMHELDAAAMGSTLVRRGSRSSISMKRGSISVSDLRGKNVRRGTGTVVPSRRQHPPQLSSRMTVVTLRGRVVRDCYCTSFSCTCSLPAAQPVLSISIIVPVDIKYCILQHHHPTCSCEKIRKPTCSREKPISEQHRMLRIIILMILTYLFLDPTVRSIFI